MSRFTFVFAMMMGASAAQAFAGIPQMPTLWPHITTDQSPAPLTMPHGAEPASDGPSRR
ncbi:hypothetical protein O4H61_09290 [Roseovarius aestuarii]|nr:hypothetical protein [Roseovarius aestuarii]